MLTESGFIAARQALMSVSATTEEGQYSSHSLHSDIKILNLILYIFRGSLSLSFPLA